MARTFHRTEPLDTRRKAGRRERTVSPQPVEEVLAVKSQFDQNCLDL